MSSPTVASSMPSDSQPQESQQTDMQAMATLNLQLAIFLNDIINQGVDKKLPQEMRTQIDKLISGFVALNIDDNGAVKPKASVKSNSQNAVTPESSSPPNSQIRRRKTDQSNGRKTKQNNKRKKKKKKKSPPIIHKRPPLRVAQADWPTNWRIHRSTRARRVLDVELPPSQEEDEPSQTDDEPSTTDAGVEGLVRSLQNLHWSLPATAPPSPKPSVANPIIVESEDSSSSSSPQASRATFETMSSTLSSPPQSPEPIKIDEPAIAVDNAMPDVTTEDLPTFTEAIQAELAVDFDEPEVAVSDTIPGIVPEDLPKPMEDVQAELAEDREERELLTAWNEGYDATPTVNMAESSVAIQDAYVPEEVMKSTTEDAPSSHTVELEMTEVVEEPAIQDTEMATAPPLTNSVVIMAPLVTLPQSQPTPTVVANVPPPPIPPPQPTITVGSTIPASTSIPPPTTTAANSVYLPYTLRAQPTSQSSRAEQVVAPQSSGNGDLKGKLDFLTMENQLRAVHSYAMSFSLGKQHPAAFDLPWNHEAAMKRLMDWLIKSSHLGRGAVHQAEEKLKDMCRPGSPASAAEELLWQCNAFISQTGLQPTQLPSQYRITYEHARLKGVRDIYNALVSTNLEIIRRGLEARPMPWASLRILAIREEYGFLATRLGTTQPRGEHLYQRYIRERVTHWQDVEMMCLLFSPPEENHNLITLKRSMGDTAPALSSKRVKEADDGDQVDEEVEQIPRVKRQSDQQVGPADCSKRRARDEDQEDVAPSDPGRRVFAPLRGPRTAGK